MQVVRAGSKFLFSTSCRDDRDDFNLDQKLRAWKDGLNGPRRRSGGDFQVRVKGLELVFEDRSIACSVPYKTGCADYIAPACARSNEKLTNVDERASYLRAQVVPVKGVACFVYTCRS